MLTRLAVFAGGRTLEAAEAICGDRADVLAGLARLVEHSLTVSDQYRVGWSLRAACMMSVRKLLPDGLFSTKSAPANGERKRERTP